MLCSAIHQTLDNLLVSDSFASLDAETLRHIRTCAVCRGYIEVLLAAIGGQMLPIAAEPAADHHLDEELASYIDLERLNPGQGRLRYPAVDSHLRICPDCYKEYSFMNEMLQDASLVQLTIPSPSLNPAIDPTKIGASLPASLNPTIWSWSRPVMNRLVQRIQSLSGLIPGVRGDGDLGPAFYRHTLGFGYNLAFRVLHVDDQYWQIVVALEPPLQATVVLAFGNEEFQATFSEDGLATLPPIPATLFTNPAGPALNIRLE